MNLPNDVPIEASSGIDRVMYLKETDQLRWKSNPEDLNPTLTITVSDENSYIDEVEVIGVQYIESMILTVIDEDGNEVNGLNVHVTCCIIGLTFFKTVNSSKQMKLLRI